ncbi:MAG TPA: DUF371 domain-containing protein [Nitrososphaerales archaeon]|nr:DUF371 domain-containing protein [Nitrososphaerales archaeon]
MRALEEASVVEVVPFTGHPMMLATHERTVEITTETHLTQKGDCILGVGASKGVAQLSPQLKAALKTEGARVKLTLVAPAGVFSFWASGSKDLVLEDPRDMVVRKSGFVCARTLAIRAESGAVDIPREIVRSLKSQGAPGTLRIEVEG